eukprot:m.269122 g.269122  ORF g.269122 m.269122 type:complete len:571 (+) comp26824_c0_seq1:315-2027(+)
MSLVPDYASSEDEGAATTDSTKAVVVAHPTSKSMRTFSGLDAADAAPVVTFQGDPNKGLRLVAPGTKAVFFNPTHDELARPQVGPANPNKKHGEMATKNTWNGYVEAGEVSEFNFEDQRRTFDNMGYALDPSVSGTTSVHSFVGSKEAAVANKGNSYATSGAVRAKRRRKAAGEAGAGGEDEHKWAAILPKAGKITPSDEQLATLEQWRADPDEANAKKKTKAKEEKAAEKSVLHIGEELDYLGRTYMHAPADIDTKLGVPPPRCFLPKREIHKWTGHTKGVNTVKLLPQTAHLLLTCAMDNKVKLWEVYGKRRLLRTFHGHTAGVRDIAFNNDGSRFLSAGYDKMVRLWDTETGACISRFTNKKNPLCVKFHPDEDKQNLFVAGTQDKKILCYDTNSGEVVQEYDRHLGAVNSITFVEDGRRMVTTSDDKSIRVWEWDIPVDMKYIADPTMHSMPAVALHPNKKWMILQSLDNKINTFGASDRFRQNTKKTFKGHMSAGYACGLGVSPDGAYVITGDGEGHLVIYDWKSTKRFAKIRAHDQVCMDVLWHPYETSKVITCGWDGLVKLWD